MRVKFFSIAGILIISLLIFEFFLRIFNPMGIRFMLDLWTMDKELYELGSIPERVRQLRPNTDRTIGGIRYFINAHGIRDSALGLQKSADEKRILFLGDSVVFGIGVPLESTFSKRLEYFLNITDRSKTYRSIPAGILGYNTREEYYFLTEIGDKIKPDFVVVVFVGNDSIDHSGWRRGLEIVARKDLSTLASAKEYIYLTVADTLRQSLAVTAFVLTKRKIFPKRAANDATHNNAIPTENLAKIKEWAQQRQIPLLVCAYDRIGLIEEFCKNATIPFYDISLLEQERLLYRNSLFDSHPNEKGHLRLARNMVRVFSQNHWKQSFFPNIENPVAAFDSLFREASN